jgi:hypothetical protein
VRRTSFAEEGHGRVVLTGGMEWWRRLGGKSAVAGGLRHRGGLMVLQRDKGGVEALRRCRFMEEKQLHGMALVNHYAKV